jgi:hypothetical protein
VREKRGVFVKGGEIKEEGREECKKGGRVKGRV